MSNVSYSFVGDASKNELAFESKVSSFGLDHVTKKDLVSFYLNFSTQTYFDTGLLPVDGSGVLSIRTAGNHTQIGYQHAPGMYYINWGSYERDPNAQKIYVAQPYRIVIADLYNGNILGARTFYSPIPIQHPSTPLYHVNLPNINCKGYRGNGVGWICLYHNEDISSYPFNEKIAKILERCSGVEAYNDQNMSETDGPRFYGENKKPRHTWDPSEWQKYSEEHGIEWTLDPDLWIPVLVNNRDDQGKHVANGSPLTYADAILGDYQAYYTDPIRPKLINKISREDLTVSITDIFNIFKMTYNTSQEFGSKVKTINPLQSTLEVREHLSTINLPQITNDNDEDEDEDEEDENIYICDGCNSITFNINTDDYLTLFSGEIYCTNCANEYTVFVDHLDAHFNSEDDSIYNISNIHTWVYLPTWKTYVDCGGCNSRHPYDISRGYMPDMVPIFENDSYIICPYCSSFTSCSSCGNMCIPMDKDSFDIGTRINSKTFEKSYVCNYCKHNEISHVEISTDLSPDTILTCLCGSEDHAKNFVDTNVTLSVFYDTDSELHKLISTNYKVVSHCEDFHLSDKSIAMSDYKHNHYANLISMPSSHSYYVVIDKMCSKCQLDTFDNFSAFTSLKLTNIFKNNDLCEKISSTQSDRKIAGLYVTCQNSF